MPYMVVRIHDFARSYWRLTSLVKQCQRVQNEFPMLGVFRYSFYNLICLDALASFLYVFLSYAALGAVSIPPRSSLVR